MTHDINLQWKEYQVDLDKVLAAIKAIDPSCCGLSAGNELKAHFTQDPSAIPMETVQAPVLDENGDPVLDENDQPLMQDVVQPSGEPSKKELVEQYWAALTDQSQEATTYRSRDQIEDAKKTLKLGIVNKTWNTMNAVERKLQMGLEVTKDELIAVGAL